jgi:hypothetical protein
MLFDCRQAQNVLMEAIAKAQATIIPEEELAEIKNNVRTCYRIVNLLHS